MTPHQFVTRWQAADLSERAACQSHFADLCAVLGQPKPSDVDPNVAWYAFEIFLIWHVFEIFARSG